MGSSCRVVHPSFRIPLVTVLLGMLVGGSMARAQFGLPKIKIPKIGKQEPKPAARVKKLLAPAPEITAITPDSAPPGGEGRLILTGKNLIQSVDLRILCENGGADAKVKVESPERAVAEVLFSENAEGPCHISLVYGRGGGGEIVPAREASPEISQEQSVGFSISDSSPMPVGLGKFMLIPEEEMRLLVDLDARGQKMRRAQEQAEKDQDTQKLVEEAKQAGKERDLQKMMELAQQMQQKGEFQVAQQQGMLMGADAQRLSELEKQEKLGKLLLEAGSLKFVAEDATLFTEPVSAVKQIAELKVGGESKGIFRIAFKDGKTYAFKDTEVNQQGMERIKKRLGK